jgi:hypothetical protein
MAIAYGVHGINISQLRGNGTRAGIPGSSIVCLEFYSPRPNQASYRTADSRKTKHIRCFSRSESELPHPL